uniref:Uncharacterized protein n=1 Tax=Arundo donax TaxID=35708 RepID=A0A0A9CX22_ARUDO
MLRHNPQRQKAPPTGSPVGLPHQKHIHHSHCIGLHPFQHPFILQHSNHHHIPAAHNLPNSLQHLVEYEVQKLAHRYLRPSTAAGMKKLMARL